MKTPEILNWQALSPQQRNAALARPDFGAGQRERDVAAIIATVRSGSDQALLDYTEKFDGVKLDHLRVPAADIAAAANAVDAALLQAIDNSIARIRAFHAAGMPRPVSLDTAAGLRCEAVFRPINPVGLYVPGGSAPLISTVLMLAIPANLAGCSDIVLCTPPRADGSVDPAILAAASRCGVTQVFRVGGAQAIAAMAFGSESIPSCAKLFGPGNAWVTEAKQQVAGLPGGAAQDMPAGPSEVLVIADAQADAEAVAWDLLSQAEHGPDSQSLLLSDSRALLEKVAEAMPRLAASLPRAEILEISLRALRLVETESIASAVAISNLYAAEHLIINCSDAARWLPEISTAGSVFVGPWTPESLGDYSSGTNHVLPTYGYANAYSGLSVSDFLRRMTIQTAEPQGLRTAGADTVLMAAAEGLDAHRMAVQHRLDALAGSGQ
jgi:histidinol dehydrogenase